MALSLDIASATDSSASPSSCSVLTSVVRSKLPGYSNVMAKPSSSKVLGSSDPQPTASASAQATSASAAKGLLTVDALEARHASEYAFPSKSGMENDQRI